MTNTPSLPETDGGTDANSGSSRIQRPVILFVVMLLGLGVLLLAASNMDPRSFASSQTRYLFWRSSDGHLTMQRPSDWLPVASNAAQPFIYRFVVDPNLSSAPKMDFVMQASRYDAPAQGLPADVRSPKAYMDYLVKQGSLKITQNDVHPATAGGYSGYMAHARLEDPTNAQATLDGEIWMLGLDADHVMLITFVSEAGDWARYQALFERSIQTLTIDPDFVRVLDLAPAATGAATESATGPATDATAAATQAATAQPTAESTAAATAAQ